MNSLYTRVVVDLWVLTGLAGLVILKEVRMRRGT